jgi:hypothetical protein
MSNRVIPAVAMVAALGWAVSLAQSPVGNPTPKPKGDAQPFPNTDVNRDDPTFELRMYDDTVMKVVLLDTSVALLTKYGKLVIPATEIRRMEFGFRYPAGVEAKIVKAIVELGSPDFHTREDAEQRLAHTGHFAIPNLHHAVKSEDPEVRRRSEEVLKLLEGKLGEGKPELRNYDVVETAEFTAKGQLQLGMLSVRTKYFGDAIVKLTDIRSFRSVGSTCAAEFSLDAARYAKMNHSEWMETSIEVCAGQQLEVTGSGRVDQWPQTPGQYMAGPEGLAGVWQGIGGIGLPGQVIGRIGANGTPFIIGAMYRSKATDNGKLYLRIVSSPWNCESTGSYKIIVSVAYP